MGRFKAALAKGGPLAGIWCQVPSPTLAEIFAHAGADWLLFDLEHGQADLADLRLQLQAANGSDCAIVVRTPGHDPTLIKRLLDLGCETLLVPMVETVDQARALVAATRYPPAGIRGVAGVTRASGYGREAGYLADAADRVCLLVQVESPAALEHADAIAAVEGVDGLFAGPGDLAAGLGVLGQPRHPDVDAAVARVLAAATAAGKPAGTFGLTPQDAAARFAEGFRFVSAFADVRLLVKETETYLAAARGAS